MKRLLTILLSAALLLAGCGGQISCPAGPESGSQADQSAPGPGETLSALALRETVYPEYPKMPEMDLSREHTDAEWEAYDKAYSAYHEAFFKFRGEALTGEELDALADFAQRSTPKVLEGHEGENVIYSPVSLWMALAILSRCAGGDSQRQALDALGVSDIDALAGLADHLWRRLYVDDGAGALLPANSVWLNSALEGAYVQETLDSLAEDFHADTYAVPMGDPAADDAVTAWIADRTRGLIGGDGPVVETDSLTTALLVSSLYYKAAWTDEFDEGLTGEDTFTAADGTESTVDFMHKTYYGDYLRGENWRGASLTLNVGDSYGRMTFVLPDEGTSPEALLQSPGFLGQLGYGARDQADLSHYGEIRWSVPKFDVDSDLDLKDTLAALGITDLLDPDKADLSPLTSVSSWIDRAEQLSRVKVDEHGVEAAAVTILDAGGGMPPEPEEPCIMDLDRPFLFVIEAENLPLFVGVVNSVQ